MKDQDWRTIKVLYEQKSITKAAEILFITQSALTKRIKSIENEWNIQLVNRNSKGITFTEDGKYLASKASAILALLDDISNHYAEQRQDRELVKIGVPNSFARLHLSKLLKGFLENSSDLQFETVPNSSDMILKQLIGKEIHMGIICGDYGFIGDKIKLFDEALFLLAPKGVCLEDAFSFPLIESYLNPLVKSSVDQWWRKKYGAMPREIQSVPYSDIAIEMVENGLGISFIIGDNWSVDQDKVDIIPIYDDKGEQIKRNVWLMMNDTCYTSSGMMKFITYVKQYYNI